jgi:hypothetical protein
MRHIRHLLLGVFVVAIILVITSIHSQPKPQRLPPYHLLPTPTNTCSSVSPPAPVTVARLPRCSSSLSSSSSRPSTRPNLSHLITKPAEMVVSGSDMAEEEATIVANDEWRSYYRADWLQQANEGLTNAMFSFMRRMIDASCMRRTYVLPHIRTRIDVDDWIPWHALFDYKNFSKVVHARYGIRLIPPELVPSPLGDANHRTCRLKTITGSSPSTIMDINNIARREDANTMFDRKWGQPDWIGTGHDLATDHQTLIAMSLVYLRPAERIMAIIEPLRRLLGSYACLHLRTEEDFRIWFDTDTDNAYFDSVTIANRIVSTMMMDQAVDMGTTPASFAADAEYRGYERSLLSTCQRLYVAGEHSHEVQYIQGLFGMLFSEIDTKETLFGAALSLTNVELALLDQEICSAATVFIGNNHSGWSERVWQRRAFNVTEGYGYKRQAGSDKFEPDSLDGYGTWQQHGAANLQVNRLKPGEDVTSPLNAYCPQKYVPCSYYRVN